MINAPKSSKAGEVPAPKRDESLVGGYYHGPSNQPGLTAREYSDMLDAWEDEKYNARYDY